MRGRLELGVIWARGVVLLLRWLVQMLRGGVVRKRGVTVVDVVRVVGVGEGWGGVWRNVSGKLCGMGDGV